VKRAGLRGGAASTLLLLALLWLVGCSEKTPPSVLLITLDTTRADRLGVYGYDTPTSPNLDALGRAGVVFEQAISTASNTPVSHASILTGQYPYHHGLRVLHGSFQNRLPESALTLAERFRQASYRTAAFVSAFPVSRRFGLQQGFDVFDEDFLVGEESGRVSKTGVINTGMNQRRADATTDRALATLRASPGPFFAWVHYFDPHDVLMLPPEEFVNPREVEGIQRDKLRILYDEEIRFMDREIGRLLAGVAHHDDLIVAVVADHGEGLGDHDWWTHGVLYQEQIRVPLMIRAASAPAGRRVRHLVRSIDIAPTLLDLAGLDVPQDIDGRSLVPLFSDATPAPGYSAYSDSFSPTVYTAPTLDPMILFTDDRSGVLISIVREGYKYVHHVSQPEKSELYHLGRDPGEIDNRLIAEPEVAERMRVDLEARDWRMKLDTEATPMSPEEIERLRALGYLASPD